MEVVSLIRKSLEIRKFVFDQQQPGRSIKNTDLFQNIPNCDLSARKMTPVR